MSSLMSPMKFLWKGSQSGLREEMLSQIEDNVEEMEHSDNYTDN